MVATAHASARSRDLGFLGLSHPSPKIQGFPFCTPDSSERFRSWLGYPPFWSRSRFCTTLFLQVGRPQPQIGVGLQLDTRGRLRFHAVIESRSYCSFLHKILTSGVRARASKFMKWARIGRMDQMRNEEGHMVDHQQYRRIRVAAGTPPPPLAGKLSVPAEEITWSASGWIVTSDRLVPAGAMHLANELNWLGPHLGSIPFPTVPR